MVSYPQEGGSAVIHILCADITGADQETCRKLWEKATPHRKARAQSYRRQEDALRCVTADALLRYVLGTNQYTVTQEKGGKPRIPEKPDFHYNLSHSGRWVVLAWGDGEVGVDVEEIRPDVNLQALARRYFTGEEQAYILEKDSLDRFFDLWTRKESYLKYLGTGLAKSLNSFSVLNGETGMNFWQQALPGNCRICLCSGENEVALEIMDLHKLL